MQDPTAPLIHPDDMQGPVMIDLFPDDTAEVAPAIEPTVTEYRRAFRALRWYKTIQQTADEDEKRILAQIEQEILNVKDFYERKRKQAAQRIAFWHSQLDAMMALNGVEKMATPYGTSFYKNVTTKTWLKPDEELFAFAKATGEPSLITTKEYLSKSMLEKYIDSTGKGEELINKVTETRVQVRLKDGE